jgi:hypothetical protein
VRSVLKTVDQLSKISSNLHELETAISLGSAILTGVEGLLGLDTTSCLAAYRASLAPALTRPFVAQFSALLTPPAPSDVSVLNVQNGRLFIDSPKGTAPYNSSDFVLISVDGVAERDDVSRLSFNLRRLAALKAMGEGAEGLERAKGLLTTVYAEMLGSPDLISAQADHLFDLWRQELVERKALLDKTRSLTKEGDADEGTDTLSPVAKKLNSALRRLDI